MIDFPTLSYTSTSKLPTPFGRNPFPRASMQTVLPQTAGNWAEFKTFNHKTLNHRAEGSVSLGRSFLERGALLKKVQIFWPTYLNHFAVSLRFQPNYNLRHVKLSTRIAARMPEVPVKTLLYSKREEEWIMHFLFHINGVSDPYKARWI